MNSLRGAAVRPTMGAECAPFAIAWIVGKRRSTACTHRSHEVICDAPVRPVVGQELGHENSV
ncbi:MAG: hypothetical protein BMS9Abin20_0693 [Acidimicrobiia bacterium]|nr:MAG: hypothetical protein BMS9Abin20_0693 [Acidimicrobiia bacterium]